MSAPRVITSVARCFNGTLMSVKCLWVRFEVWSGGTCQGGTGTLFSHKLLWEGKATGLLFADGQLDTQEKGES